MTNSALPTQRLSPLPTITGLLSFILIGAAQALYGPSLPVFTEAFDLSAGAAGMIVSVHSAGAVIGVGSAIPLSRLPIARWRVAGAFILLTLGALLIATGLSWIFTLIGGLIVGTAYGALTIGINSLFAVGYGRRSPAMVNLLNAIFGVGAILSPLLFLLNFSNPRTPFFILAVFGTLLVPLGFIMDDRVPTVASKQQPRRNWGALLAFIVLLGLGVGIEASTVGYAATYLISVGVSASGAATATSLFFLLFTLSRLAAIPLSLRARPYQIVLGSLGLTTFFLVATNSTQVAPAAVVLLGASLAVFFPNCFNWLNNIFGATNGTAFILAGALVGGMIIPALIAQLIPIVGETSIMSIIAVVNVVALMVGLIIKTRLTGHE